MSDPKTPATESADDRKALSCIASFGMIPKYFVVILFLYKIYYK